MKLRRLYFVVFMYVLALAGYSVVNNRPSVLSSAVAQHPVQFAQVSDAPDPSSVFELVNQQRSSAGLVRLEPDSQLMAVAEARAQDMALRRYYAHENPDKKHFGHLLADADIRANYSCENLNLNFTLEPQPYVNEWMASSSGHRSCLLHPGVVRAGYAVAVWDEVSVMGVPQKAFVVVAIHASN